METIGSRLKQARKNCGLKQDYFLKHYGITQSDISKAENDASGGRPTQLKLIDIYNSDFNIELSFFDPHNYDYKEKYIRLLIDCREREMKLIDGFGKEIKRLNDLLEKHLKKA